MTENELIYDWNRQGETFPDQPAELVDHTLADCPANPQILGLLAAVGVTRVVVSDDSAAALARDHGLAAVKIVERGFPQEWGELPPGSTLVLHDAGRTEPAWLAEGLEAAWRGGLESVCLADSSGACVRAGARSLVRFARTLLEHLGADLRLEWLGGNQRGLALSNALEAWHQGADRVHGSVFGTDSLLASELWLVNQKLYGAWRHDLSGLKSLCEAVSRHCGVTIYPNRPVVGADAFRTGTGVHAAAIIKAQAKGHDWLADLVYSGVPAGQFGFHQIIEIGPMAGASNVQHWLRRHSLEPDPDSVQRILARAKASDRVLTDQEIREALANSPE